MAYSVDGVSWIRVVDSPFPSTYGSNSRTYPINAIAYVNGRFVAGGSGVMTYCDW